jgi:hypothetical protein
MGVALFGAAYLVESAREPAGAARALDFNLIGALHPAAVLMGWLACVCLLVAGFVAARKLARKAAGPALLVGSLASILVLLEGCARIVAIVSPEPQGFPTNRARMWDDRHVRWNMAGFRDVDHEIRASPGKKRLLVVGDSYAHGAGVDEMSDRFGERLSLALSSATGAAWEVITAARPDTDTQDHLEFLGYGLRHSPDVVLLLYVFNDIDYITPVTRRTVLTEHPQTTLERLHPLRILMKNSFLAQEFYARWRHLRYANRGGPAADPYGDPAILSAHIADLAAFGTRATSGGARWAIVPFDISVVASPASAERYRHFVEAATAAGLPVLSLAQAFEGRAFERLAINRLDGHPNSESNRLAAEAVAAQLATRLTAGSEPVRP